MSDIPLTRAMRGVYPNLHAPKGTKRIGETNRTVWESAQKNFREGQNDRRHPDISSANHHSHQP